MRLRLLCIFSLLLLAAPMALAQAAADESKILAMENAWNQAQLHHDAKAMDSLVADSYVNTESDGSVQNKAEFLASIKDKAAYHAETMSNSDVKVRLYGNVAVVTGAYRAKGVASGKPFDNRGRFTDTWLLLNGRWQCVASHASHIPK